MDENARETEEPTPRGCVYGFIATEPTLIKRKGVYEFSARFGIERSRNLPDGTREQLEPHFHTIIAHHELARVAYRKFRKGDSFIAAGDVGRNKKTGKPHFEAEAIGHNASRTRYEVERRPRFQSAANDMTHARPIGSEGIRKILGIER